MIRTDELVDVHVLVRLFEDEVAVRSPMGAVEGIREAVLNPGEEHHAEEERELFPAVLRSAHPGMEKERVRHMVDALTREHRDIEKQWALLEPGLKKLAKGQPAEIDGAAVDKLIAQYQAHARYEEQEFLPLSHEILARDSNHMAALGLSLHIRHLKQGIGGHV